MCPRLGAAADSAIEGQASDLGYSDQAHLIRDFRAAIWQTPAAYADAQAAISAGTARDLR